MTTEPKRRGRPRSQASREAILRAAAELMAPGHLSRLTMEGIAQRAGVSKQTVYRWWPTKIDVLVESIGEGYLDIPLPLPEDTGDLRRDLTVWLEGMREEIEGGGASSLSQALIGALALQDQQGSAIRGVLVDPLVEAMTVRLHAAGLAETGDIEFAVDNLGAIIMMHVLFGRPMSDDWIERVVSRVLAGESMVHARLSPA